jgi:hypothetical protein
MRTTRLRSLLLPLLLALALGAPAGLAAAYPLDGYEYTGITRLLHQRKVQEGELEGRERPPGELLPLERVDLRLRDRKGFTLPEPSPALTAEVRRLLGPEADRYGIALLDLSDPDAPRYAEWNGGQRQNPGSVGKILVALAIFQALADAWPDDVAARERVLRQSMITADVFSVYDHHTVRFFDPVTSRLVRRPIQKGDTASLWTYLDWMMSPSSNSAAGMLQKHLILLAHFGKRYPVPPAEADRFFRETSRKELGDIFLRAITGPVTRNGLDLDALRQGSFFTHEGKKRVAGTSSYATPRSLMRFLVKMEQGELVDRWSSREIKRLLYVTERRIRYGSSGALRRSAVYFKSGSLYSCQPEPGFTCKKYHGNKRNYMNSVAVVETPAGGDRLYYMVTVLSNVLRKNSAVDHRDLARAIHGLLLADHPPAPTPEGAVPASLTFGEGFIGFAEERDEIVFKAEVQEVLLALGYDIGAIDGLIGPNTREGIRDYQRQHGLPVTGQPTPALLEHMRATARERGLMRPAAD